MTVENTTRLVRLSGNGATTEWPYTFKIPTSDDLVVSLFLKSTNAETVLDPADYSVTGIGTDDGGAVTYPLTGSPVSSLYYVVIKREVALKQELDITNQDGFYPESVEAQLDLMVMQNQQLSEIISRSIVTPPSLDPVDYEEFTAALLTAATNSAEIVTVAGLADDIGTLADLNTELSALGALSTEITALGALGSQLTTLAAIDTEIGTVAGLDTEIGALGALDTELAALGAITADIPTVAGLDTEIAALGALTTELSTLHPISADIVTLAALDTELIALGAISADITTVAGIADDISDAESNASAAATSAANAAASESNVALAAVPIGHIGICNGDDVDPGYLRFGEGGSFDRATYPDFATWWDANGDKWGMSPSEIAAGDLPDFTDRVFRTAGGPLGPAVGATQEDAFQGHGHSRDRYNQAQSSAGFGGGLYAHNSTLVENTTGVVSDGVNGTPRTATETRVKSIGVRYQIKAYGALVNSGTADLVAIEAAQAQAVRKDAQTLSDAEKLQILDNLGTLLNRSYTENGSAASSTNNVNVDTSIPQITEGAQAVSTSYTPKKIGSTICVKAVVYASCNNNRDVTGSLFIDGGADAVAVVSKSVSTNEGEQMNIEYSFTPTDLSAIAIEARAGSHTDTCWVNRRSSSDYFGGLMKSTMTIEEYS